jgi:hypothetical protein
MPDMTKEFTDLKMRRKGGIGFAEALQYLDGRSLIHAIFLIRLVSSELVDQMKCD